MVAEFHTLASSDEGTVLVLTTPQSAMLTAPLTKGAGRDAKGECR